MNYRELHRAHGVNTFVGGSVVKRATTKPKIVSEKLLDNLEKLIEAVGEERWEVCPDYHQVYEPKMQNYISAVGEPGDMIVEYIARANPATVLKMVREIRAYRRRGKA